MISSSDNQRSSLTPEVTLNPELSRNILVQLAANSLTVAENLRDNYFKNTRKFVSDLRRRISSDGTTAGRAPIMRIKKIDDLQWKDIKGETVSFIDGGVGHVELAQQIPIVLRVGSYTVRPDATRLAERERFAHYPVLLGNLQGGSKERRDFPDIVRIIAELLGGIASMERNSKLDVLMFHGPLMYMMSAYPGHTPFTESDIDLFLQHYAGDQEFAESLKNEFINEARKKIYPRILPSNPDFWAENRLFEPISWIAFLYRKLLKIANQRKPQPLIVGVVERGGNLKEFSNIILRKVFDGLRESGNQDYFNTMFGRNDLTNEKNLLDRLGYTDSLLMAMIMSPGYRSDKWIIRNKTAGLRNVSIQISPGESPENPADFSPLQSSEIGFPEIAGFYINIAETVEPIRVEVFSDLGRVDETAQRAYLYARLLPEYGFPVGLDIADKYAKVPAWMTEGYAKLIRHHLGVSMQRGDVSDAELRKIMQQAIYMGHRDWLFRPKI